MEDWTKEPTNQRYYNVENLQPDAAYTLQVRARGDQNQWRTITIPKALKAPGEPRWSAIDNTFSWNKVDGAVGYSARAVDTAGATGQNVPPPPTPTPDDDEVICPSNSDRCYVEWARVTEGDTLHVQACATLVKNENGDGICEISEDYRSSPVASLRVRVGSTIMVSFGEDCPGGSPSGCVTATPIPPTATPTPLPTDGSIPLTQLDTPDEDELRWDDLSETFSWKKVPNAPAAHNYLVYDVLKLGRPE